MGGGQEYSEEWSMAKVLGDLVEKTRKKTQSDQHFKSNIVDTSDRRTDFPSGCRYHLELN